MPWRHGWIFGVFFDQKKQKVTFSVVYRPCKFSTWCMTPHFFFFFSSSPYSVFFSNFRNYTLLCTSFFRNYTKCVPTFFATTQSVYLHFRNCTGVRQHFSICFSSKTHFYTKRGRFWMLWVNVRLEDLMKSKKTTFFFFCSSSPIEEQPLQSQICQVLDHLWQLAYTSLGSLASNDFVLAVSQQRV